MKGEHTCAVGETDTFAFFAPVAVITPAVAFVGMAIPGPTFELVEKDVVQAAKLGFSNRKLVVVAPALNDRIEGVNKRGLCRAAMLANQITQAVAVTL